MVRISASILGFYFDAKHEKLAESSMIENINKALLKKKNDFEILHLDIEDGVFVNQKSFSPQQTKKISKTKKREAHLMVVDYKKYIKEYVDQADMFIIHNEVLKRDFPETISYLRSKKKFIGLAINPETPVSSIKHLDKIDLVLVMSVHPGLPGQKFLPGVLVKVRKLKELRKQGKLNFVIEMDGGINKENSKECIKSGADILVMGTGLFNG